MDLEQVDRQISRVCKIKVSPMAKGCCRRVKRYEVPVKRADDRIKRVISESSLIKILVLGIGDRENPSF